MSEPSPPKSPAPADNHDQATRPARTPGPRTPRRVQWATAVDDDEDEDDRDSEHHGLDQAGLDVCTFSFPLCFYSQFFYSTACCLPNPHSCPRTPSSLKFRLAASDSVQLCSCPTTQTASIIHTLLCRVILASFSQMALIWD